MMKRWISFLSLLLVTAMLCGALAENLETGAEVSPDEFALSVSGDASISPDSITDEDTSVELSDILQDDELQPDNPAADAPTENEEFISTALLGELTLTVQAASGVFSPGSELNAADVEDEALVRAAEALVESDARIQHTLFDIMVTDPTGNESLPDTSAGMPVAKLQGLPLASIAEANPGAKILVWAALSDPLNGNVRLVNTWTEDEAVMFELPDIARCDVMIIIERDDTALNEEGNLSFDEPAPDAGEGSSPSEAEPVPGEDTIPVGVETASESVETTPVADNADPGSEEETPVIDVTAPGADEADPAIDVASGAEETVPSAEETASAVEEMTPVTDNADPDSEEETSVIDVTAPGIDETDPAVDVASAAEETIPSAEETASAVEETAPVTDNADPGSEGETPVIDVTAPAADETDPAVDVVSDAQLIPIGEEIMEAEEALPATDVVPGAEEAGFVSRAAQQTDEEVAPAAEGDTLPIDEDTSVSGESSSPVEEDASADAEGLLPVEYISPATESPVANDESESREEITGIADDAHGETTLEPADGVTDMPPADEDEAEPILVESVSVNQVVVTRTASLGSTAKTLQYTSAGYSGNYDGKPHGISVSVADPATGATVRYGTTKGTYDKTSSPTYTDQGQYTVYYQITASGYTSVTGQAVVTINTVTVSSYTIELSESSFDYDGTAKKPTIKSVKTGTLTIPASEYTVSYSNNTNAGTATVKLTDVSGGNFVFNGLKTFTINPKTVSSPTIALSASSYAYDGTEKKPTVTVKDGTKTIPSGEYTVSYLNNINAGSATVKIIDKAGGNYTVNGSKTFTIKPKTVTKPTIALSATSYTADGTAKKPTVTSVKDGTTVIPVYEYAVSYANNVNAGTATVKITDKTGGNYTVSGTKTFTIKAAAASKYTIVLSASSYTYDGTAKKPTVKSVKLGSTVIPASEYTVSYANNVNAGTATVKITDKSGGQYTVTGTKAFTINPKTVSSPTIALSASSYTYDGAAKKPTATVKDGTKTIPASEYSVVYVNNVHAGTATVKIIDKNGGNYTVSGSKTFTIKPKAVTSPTITLSTTSYTYSGDAKKPAVTSVKNGSVLIPANEYSVSYANNVKAGTATVKITDKSGGDYTVSGSKTFTIKPKTVSLAWKNVSFTYDKKSHLPTATATGLVSGDTCTVTVSGARTAAGSGTATASKLSNANYALPSAKTKTFTIKPKTVGLSWSNLSFTYDKKSHLPTATATGVISGDTCTVTVSGARTAAGSGTATASKLSNANYALPSAKTKAFTIKPKTVGLSWSNLSFTYDKKSHLPTATATGVISGDTCTVTVSGARTAAGTGTATASKLSNANYQLPASNLTKSFSINKKTVGLSWTKTFLGHTGTVQAPTATATGLIDGDTCTVTVTGGQTDPGSYTATASGLSNSNYALPTTTTKAFTISPFEMDIAGTITGYVGTESAITIPDTDPDGNPITAIGAHAFEDCSTLVSVSIPNGVTTIGQAAFKNCANLKTMTTFG